ncbi:MAG: ferrous iron transport protein A [Cytophagales bacterium]|nr:MAG: ferrous iron transport protein A [Cytophagales bacterium]
MLEKNLSQLEIGEKGIISNFKDEEMSLKLIEMGCLPGVDVEVLFKAPWGGPICIAVSGYNLSLRRDEAATIVLQN